MTKTNTAQNETNETLRRLAVQGEAMKFSVLPDDPKPGVWYSIMREGYITANGQLYRGSIKIGTENNLMVMFEGGGVSINEYTEAHPVDFDSSEPEQFYFRQVEPVSYVTAQMGLVSDEPENKFRNWSKVIIHYASGDFHTGVGDYHYIGKDGREQVVHHHGFRNYRMVLEMAMQYLPAPDRLLIIGGSAGAFGVSALADDVIGHFPECSNITVCMDSALIKADWKKAAETMWKSPKKILDVLKSEDFALDNLEALYRKYGSSIKYLYCQSVRDGAFVQYENWNCYGNFDFSQEGGEEFFEELKLFIEKMKKIAPGTGFYLFDIPISISERAARMHLTDHTLLTSANTIKPLEDGLSYMDWIWNAIEGKVSSAGLHLLEEEK